MEKGLRREEMAKIAVLCSLLILQNWQIGWQLANSLGRRNSDFFSLRVSLHQLRKRRHIGSKEPEVPSTTKQEKGENLNNKM